MNVLALVGSGRTGGNSSTVVDLIGEKLRALATQHGESLSFEAIVLGRLDIRPCLGCRSCFNRGESACPLKDDLAGLRERIRAADAVVCASPVYVNDVSGLTKNLIDRLAHICHRPEFAEKCVYLVATTGGSPTGHTIHTMQGAWLSWGAHLVGDVGLSAGAHMKREEIAARHGKRIGRAASRLFDATRGRAWLHPSFVSLMMFRIQQRGWSAADPETVDHRYWRDHGWTDPRRDFFIAHEAGSAKVALARLVGDVVHRFVA
jgi:multimeric flavodoxin WrbA